MNTFLKLLLGVIGGGVLALGQSSVVMANGGHAHFGDIDIPFIVVWIGGGVLGVFFLLFFIGWGVSYRDRKRSQEEEKK